MTDKNQIRDFVSRLRKLDTCAVSDALDRLKLGGVVGAVPQQSGETRIAGRAVTVKLGVGTAPAGTPRHLGTAAVEAAGSDNVIVVEQRSGVDAGSWGGLLALGAKLRGVAGVVCDGPVRDIDEAKAHGFPIFARKLTAKTARGRIVELGTNVPVTFETVSVAPGDYVIADRSAVIFIATADIARVLETAETIAAKEAAMAEALIAGEPISRVMAANYEH
ncbi:MAG TPA: RraA family protein, partial [Micropepsaceae bacterium]|nr:RraA family protein [Micropepsaceae bacterium]